MIRLFMLSRKILRHPVGQNAVALYVVLVANYIIPLVTIPYLARVLGPNEWGIVIFFQAFASLMVPIIEYGFRLSATREIAQNREAKEQIAMIVASVLGAKGILIIGISVMTIITVFIVPQFKGNLFYLLWVWLLIIGMGMSPQWYFQGVERMRLPAFVSLMSRIIFMFGIFIFVRNQNDGWIVLALQAGTSLLGSGFTIAWLYKEIPFLMPKFSWSITAIRSGWSMFIYKSATKLYAGANVFILGLFGSPMQVAFYGGSERISRVIFSLTGPVSQAMFPRMNYLIKSNPKLAEHLFRLNLALMSALGLMLGAISFIFAPLIIRILLGPDFDSAILILRILALAIPIIAIGSVLGIQWMIPLGFDRSFVFVTVIVGMISVILAISLAPRFGAQGMAWVVVFSETLVTLGMLLALWRKHLGSSAHSR